MNKEIFLTFLLGLFLYTLVSCRPLQVISSVSSEDKVEIISSVSSEQYVAGKKDLVVIKELNLTEWSLIYDLDMVWKIEVDPRGRIWIGLGGGGIALHENDAWVSFSDEDYGYPKSPNDIVLTPEGIAWIVGNNTLSQYKDGQWESVEIPSPKDVNHTRIAVDPSGRVWVASSKCENGIILYDGLDWEIFPLPDECFEINQLISAADGSLWVSFSYPGGLGKLSKSEWTVFSGQDFSLETGPFYGVRKISIDEDGNVYGLYSGHDWTIVRVGTDSSFSTMKFDPVQLKLNPQQLTIYVDRNRSVWVNACLSNEEESCLAYNSNNIWFSFDKLPFSSVFDIAQKPDGSILVATEKGLYQFDSEE